MLTIREVASRLNASPSLVYDLLKHGRLPFIRIGTKRQGGLRIRECDLDEFLESNRRVAVHATTPVKVRLKHLKL